MSRKAALVQCRSPHPATPACGPPRCLSGSLGLLPCCSGPGTRPRDPALQHGCTCTPSCLLGQPPRWTPDSCLTRHLEPITHPTGVTRAEHREPPLTPQSSGSSPSIPPHRPSHPKHFNQPGAAQSEPYGILATSSLPSSRTTSPSGDQECRLTERVAFSSQGAGDQDPGGPCPQYTHCYCAALAYLPSNPGVHALTGVPRASQEGRSSPCLNLDRQDGALAEWGV